jgi:7-cyano-7-deazaguanine synthase
MDAVVILSGGMDSAICLALAVKKYGASNVAAVTFDYSQRHSTEIKAAQKIASLSQVKHEILNLKFYSSVADNALTNHSYPIHKNEHDGGQLLNTFVVGRNGLFARVAMIYGHQYGAKNLFVGVMGLEVANSGYPDCSREYFNLQEQIFRLDLQIPDYQIHTPLVYLTKSQSMSLAYELGILPMLLEQTVTCYEGLDKYGCGTCPSCLLRNQGIKEFLKLHPEVEFSYKNKFN